jgi:VWFA-related protein
MGGVARRETRERQSACRSDSPHRASVSPVGPAESGAVTNRPVASAFRRDAKNKSGARRSGTTDALDPLHGGRDPSDGERANRARSLTNVLEALAGHLDRVESRRKSLLLFSERIDYDLTDIMGTLQRQSSDVMKAMDRAIGALMRANVSVYPIDPRALGSAERDLVESPLYRETPSAIQSSVEAEYSDSIRGLRQIADSTGGFAAVDRNDVGPAFERIIEESSEYYVLGYTPSKRGEFRAIDVRVSRPGLRVVARKGYLVPAGRSPGATCGSRRRWRRRHRPHGAS